MIRSAQLFRSTLFALALIAFAPLAGQGAPLLGIAQAQAQTVAAVAENAAVGSVAFQGNRRFTTAQLNSMVDLATRRAYTQAGIAGDIETIRAAYDQAGYFNVSVTTRTETMSDGRLRVVFVVNEGDRAGVAAINFTGNNSIGANALKNTLVTKESHFLSWLTRDDLYDEDRLAVDRELIRLYYADRGFPDARVLSAVAEFDASRNAYFINFTIEEGERYEFGNIAIETSISGLNADAMRGAIRTNDGDRYSLGDLSRSSEDLAVRATQQGFAFAEVRARMDRDIANRTFNVTYLVDEGARVYVERINIAGNTRTRDFVIRREFDFAEGDPFNRTLVTRGRSSIEALGFFESVQVTAAPGSAPDKIVINVAVVEKSTGDYGIGGGYSTTEGVFGEISLTERNFLGRGQYLRLALGRSEVGETYDFSFTEPRFMGLKIAAGVDAYRRVVAEETTFTYGIETTGGRLRFGIPVMDNLDLQAHIGFEQKIFTDVRTNPNHKNKDKRGTPAPAYITNGLTFDKLMLGYSLTYNTLDNQSRPTEGLFLSFSQEYAGGSHDFLKSEVRARAYYPIWEEMGVVGSIRGQAGALTDLGGAGIHPSEAYILGPNFVRGFSSGGMGYRAGTNPVGVLAYAGLSAEIDFPIPMLPESWGIRGAVWGDVGWIDGRPADANAATTGLTTPLKSSVGASLIWDSPMGPLRGDFAHVIDKDAHDKTQVFQLTLSTLF